MKWVGHPTAVPRTAAVAEPIVPGPLASGVLSATRDRSRSAPGVRGSPIAVSRTAIGPSHCASIMGH